MQCQNCGKEIQEDAKFCAYCGSIVADETETEAAPKIQAKVEMEPDNLWKRIVKKLRELDEEENRILAMQESRRALHQQRNASVVEPNLPETHHLEGVTLDGDDGGDTLLDIIVQKTRAVCVDFWGTRTPFGKASLALGALAVILLVIAVMQHKTWAMVFAFVQLGIIGVAYFFHSDLLELAPEQQFIQYLVLALTLPFLLMNLLSFTWGAKKPLPEPTLPPAPEATQVPVEGEIYPPFNEEACEGYPRDSIEQAFREAGFQNVTVQPVETLMYSQKDWLDIVESVTIDKIQNFTVDRAFDSQAPVVVHYYAFQYNPVKLHIDFEENLFFNKHDVTVYLEDTELGTLSHGVSGDFTLELKPGSYTLHFLQGNDSAAEGELTLDLKGQAEIKLRITCKRGTVKIETLYLADTGLLDENHRMLPDKLFTVEASDPSTAAQALSDAGFANIMMQPIYDVTAEDPQCRRIAAVSIDGRTDLRQGEIFATDAVIIIQYHEDKEKDPASIQARQEMEALEKVFPREFARRAVVTAMTNGRASDVLMSDGVTRNPASFHSYSDLSGFFMSMEDEGIWSSGGTQTWHVQDMILKIYEYDFYMRVTADITQSGEQYILSGVEQVVAQKADLFGDDPDKTNRQTLEPSADTPWLTVPRSLLTADRDAEEAARKASEKEARQEWIRAQFNAWDGRHIELSNQIKASLTDEKSFSYISVSYIDVTDAVSMEKANSILSRAGAEQKTQMGDLLVLEVFRANNTFGTLVESTGVGIVRPDGTVQLTAIVSGTGA